MWGVKLSIFLLHRSGKKAQIVVFKNIFFTTFLLPSVGTDTHSMYVLSVFLFTRQAHAFHTGTHTAIYYILPSACLEPVLQHMWEKDCYKQFCGTGGEFFL